MKWLFIKMIDFYQKLPISSHYKCRFYPTCSNYCKEAIIEYGVIYGCFLGFKRILRCNPFCKSGYDPVPKKECCYEKN
ncbi:MAG: membrane protein insertion efficiency factor YidD [Bacilli bacterium]|nr:membrane protein insertion efficiency factor YidD [Bacilli bacterium]